MRTEVSERQGGVPTAPEKGQVSHGGSGERPPVTSDPPPQPQGTSGWGPFKFKVLSCPEGPSPSLLGSRVNKPDPRLLTWLPPVPGTPARQVHPRVL